MTEFSKSFLNRVAYEAGTLFTSEIAWFHDDQAIAALGATDEETWLAYWSELIIDHQYRFVLQELSTKRRHMPVTIHGRLHVLDGFASAPTPQIQSCSEKNDYSLVIEDR